MTIDPVTGRPEVKREVLGARMLGAGLGAEFMQFDPVLEKRDEARHAQQIDALGMEMVSILALPPNERPQAYRDRRQAIIEKTGIPVDESYSDQEALLIALQSPRARDILTTQAELAKTRAEVGATQALEAERRRPPEPKAPTKASLALAASRGDKEAQRALGFLAPKGFSFEFDKDGRLVSVTQGDGPARPPQRVISQAFDRVNNAVDTMQLIDDVDQLLSQNPAAATLTGDLQLFAQNSLDTILAIAQPKDAKDTLVQQRLTDLRAGDISEFRFLRTILEFRLALVGNPDGRISDADIRNAQRGLGTRGAIRSGRDLRRRLAVFRRQAQRQYDRQSAILRSLRQEPPALPTGGRTAPSTPREQGRDFSDQLGQ